VGVEKMTIRAVQVGPFEWITAVHWGSSAILAMQLGAGQVNPSGGIDKFPLLGLPFVINDVFALTRFTVHGSLVKTGHGGSVNFILPVSVLPQEKKSTFSFFMSIAGYGSQFIITSTQTVYVPWNTKLGVTFPGGDTDQFGNSYPVRAGGLNANVNATSIFGGSPDPAGTFLPDGGYGAWVTEANSNQQCAVLNSVFGSAVNYVTFPWVFWFTQWCGGNLDIVARTFKVKDIKGQPFSRFFTAVPPISEVRLSYTTGHGPRTSSWGFVDTGTGTQGVGGILTISGDNKTLEITGSIS
jgi:hypothetical protein